jgi:predicted murein hydrolase (TIGR00659 family)
MTTYFSNEFFLITLTFGSYFVGKLLRKWTGWVLMNPILLSILVIITFLKVTGISYETYSQSGHLIEFWLRPAVVALGVPLFLQLNTIRRQIVPILVAELCGCLVGLVSVVYIAREMGASRDVILSLAPKSVTTPIAMEITKSVGGIPSLTAAVVVCVGLLCTVCGYKTMGFARVKDPVAQGLSMGTAAHALGTATSMSVSRVHGAYASLGLTLNGLFTALFTPMILPLFQL